MNKEQFFKSVRLSLFGGMLRQGVVDTLEIILETCRLQEITDPNHIAYILATAYHEAYNANLNPNFDPVREGFANTNAGAIRAVTKLYEAKKIRVNYALPNSRGLSHYGRGFVQITWIKNYERLGKRLGIDLAGNPDLALDKAVAARILVIGMKEGLFTGVRLRSYNLNFLDNNPKPEQDARKIINGEDKKVQIAATAAKFFTALTLKSKLYA